MKHMVIMRGLPGSGKSYRARQLSELAKTEGLSCEVFSTDDLFMVGGVYRYNPEKVAEYHEATQYAVWDAINREVDLIIVDNTNITRAEIEPYIRMIGQSYSWRVEEPTSQWWWDIRPHMKGKLSSPWLFSQAGLFAEKSSHDMPPTVIRLMMERWEEI